jgi:hypothetical protein
LSVGKTIGIKGSAKPFSHGGKDAAPFFPPLMLNGVGQPSQSPGRHDLWCHDRPNDYDLCAFPAIDRERDFDWARATGSESRRRGGCAWTLRKGFADRQIVSMQNYLPAVHVKSVRYKET